MNEKRFVVWRVPAIEGRVRTRAEAVTEATEAVEGGDYKVAYVLEVLKVATRATPPVEVRDF